MAITTLAQLQAAKRQVCTINTFVSTGLQSSFNSRFATTGDPSGTLAAGNTTSGIVPTSASAGYPTIKKFASANSGYINSVYTSKDNEGRIALFDRLYVAGAFAFNVNTSLTGQPSFSSRVPNADYTGLELWLETVTTFTGIPTITVGYTNESGANSRTSTNVFSEAPITPRVFPLQLQSGDSGIQQINSVTVTGSTVGTFNLMVLRRLGDFRPVAPQAIDSVAFLDNFILEQVYDTSALYVISMPALGNIGTGRPRVQVQIVEG